MGKRAANAQGRRAGARLHLVSLIDQIDWNIALAKKEGTVNACGLFDLDRQPRPVAEAYKMLLQEDGQITIVPHGELFEVATHPAALKVEV